MFDFQQIYEMFPKRESVFYFFWITIAGHFWLLKNLLLYLFFITLLTVSSPYTDTIINLVAKNYPDFHYLELKGFPNRKTFTGKWRNL